MKKFSEFIVNNSKKIVLFSILLLVPAIFGYIKTRINYDILVYLPEDIETIKGENILTDEFGLGSYAFVMTDDEVTARDILTLEENIRTIDGVGEVFSLIDAIDISIPSSMLPSTITDKLYHDGQTIIMVTLEGSTSEDKTIEAIENLREVVENPENVSSLTAMMIDTRDLSSSEMITYIVIAVLFCLAILLIATDSYIVPLFLLGNIGFAILYNMGSNIIFGEISYITKAISAILQLGVTTDFSIFLYHQYEEAKRKKTDKKEAMAFAITETFKSVIGSSLTTFAGFLALCTMDLTLGADIGLVMAKGVLCGLITVLTLFPSLLLLFDSVLEKTKHKKILPKFTKLGDFVVRHNKGILVIFLILLVPALIGNARVESYYKLDDSLPDDLAFKVANNKLARDYGITSPEIILIDKDLKASDVAKLKEELENVSGIDMVIAPSNLISGSGVSLFPESLQKILVSEQYQLIIANSTYEIASYKLNEQIDIIHDIVKKYDDNGIIAGEGALMKDLVEIADHDFKMVNYTSILVIFIIMIFVLKQVSLPVLLVLVIEFAICLNMSVAYYTSVRLPFVASIVIGTIQLGATIDYAILMSTKYLEERKKKDKKDAMKSTLYFTIPSIITSALCFFAATFGVAVYTKIDMIGSICELLGRGSIISMIVVIMVLPSLLMLFDKLIYKNKKEGIHMKKKSIALLFVIGLLLPIQVSALEKNETIYTNLDATGSLKKSVVQNHLTITSEGEVEDYTDLNDILNITGNEKFELNQNKLIWQVKAQDIIYEGYTKKENPLSFQITYYLDGEEKELSEMFGTSGKVKIEIDIKNNLYTYKHSKKIYTPFVTLFGTYLDSNKNHSITITNGKVVNTGSRNMIVGIASPGLYDSTHLNEFKSMDKIVLEYTTDEFKVGDYYIVASPKLLEDTDLTVFQKIDVLNQSIKTFGESMNKIEKGAKELLNGSKELKDGSSVLSKELKNVYQALLDLNTGSKKIDDNLKLVLSSLVEAQNSLQNKNLDGSLAQMQTLEGKNTEAIEKLTLTNQSLKTTYDTYNLGSFTTSLDLTNYLTSIGTSSEEITKLVTVKETYEGNLSLIYLLTKNNEAIEGTISNLTTLSNEISDLITKLTGALDQIQTGTSTLHNGLEKLGIGVSKLYTGSIELSEGSSSLNEGMDTLTSGIHTLNVEGISKLVDASNQFSNMSTTFKDLVKLSKDYRGYSTNNANNTTFIYKVEQGN